MKYYTFAGVNGLKYGGCSEIGGVSGERQGNKG